MVSQKVLTLQEGVSYGHPGKVDGHLGGNQVLAPRLSGLVEAALTRVLRKSQEVFIGVQNHGRVY